MPPSVQTGSGDYDFTLAHDGLIRTFRVHVPPSDSESSTIPVVIYLHGGGGNAQSAYLDGMAEASDLWEFILVSPEGIGEIKFGELRGLWNGGEWDGGACCGDADDVGFIAAMLDDLSTRFHIDESRIYAVGISNGGLMTNRLACELSDRLAAVATVAPAAIPSHCSPSVPISVMDIHGTGDRCNPFDGSEPSLGFCRDVPYTRQSPEEVVGAWLEINKCSGQATIVYAKGEATCVRYSECMTWAQVEFCTVEGMGHTWPSGFQYLPASLVGPVSYDLSFEQMWEFLRLYQR